MCITQAKSIVYIIVVSGPVAHLIQAKTKRFSIHRSLGNLHPELNGNPELKLPLPDSADITDSSVVAGEFKLKPSLSFPHLSVLKSDADACAGMCVCFFF